MAQVHASTVQTTKQTPSCHRPHIAAALLLHPLSLVGQAALMCSDHPYRTDLHEFALLTARHPQNKWWPWCLHMPRNSPQPSSSQHTRVAEDATSYPVSRPHDHLAPSPSSIASMYMQAQPQIHSCIARVCRLSTMSPGPVYRKGVWLRRHHCSSIQSQPPQRPLPQVAFHSHNPLHKPPQPNPPNLTTAIPGRAPPNASKNHPTKTSGLASRCSVCAGTPTHWRAGLVDTPVRCRPWLKTAQVKKAPLAESGVFTVSIR